VATATGAACAYLLLRVRRPAAATEPAESPAGASTGAAEIAHKGHFPGPILVVSPHLDDGVLSCGGLLTALAADCPVTVATLFTEVPPGPISLSARMYLRGCSARDARTLYRLRREEDREVLAELGAQAVHLGLVEALFRRPEPTTPARTRAARWLPELALTYPTYRYHITAGTPARRDEQVARRAADEIATLVARHRPGTVLVPLGVGGHVDHVIARSIGERWPDLVVYYADFPYAARSSADDAFTRDHTLVPIEWHDGIAEKERLIRGYRSQFPSLFPDGTVPRLPERYLVPARRREGAGAEEPVT
jgi:LmbE family N-acetylglucosaminyl deacetylase